MGGDELVRRAQQGDPNALDQLCRREWRGVYAIAYRSLGDVSEAQDVTQEVFVRALNALQRYRDTGVPYSAYLGTITRNLIRDRWRKYWPQTVDFDQTRAIASTAPTPEERLLQTLDSQLLRQAVRRLSEDHQTVIQLRIHEGRSAAEVGRIMASPTPSATVDPSGLLSPPMASLHTQSGMVAGYLGTYDWQFSDADQTYVSAQAPIIALNEDAPPAEVVNSEQLAIRFFGEEYRTRPEQLEVAVYEYESNAATPVNPQTGQPGEGPGFAIRTEPERSFSVDPEDPTFTLDDLPPGHYVIWAQGHWGQHPQLNTPLSVTWVFDVQIVE